ncbi:MAG TPA: apolipoprotein N-acyltransferase [Rhizomicrobium sp.]|jgi:apolipoprotein N-acyltransferase|nr:apolipoprotein N-acyltransferase [Rhizomicrobium sp.]
MTAPGRLGTFVRGLSPLRARGFAFLCGAVSALGFAPIGAIPILLLGYAALVLLIDGATETGRPIRNAAWVGWAFAFGQFLTGWHWIVYAFLVDPAEHAWQIPFIALLPAFLALYIGAACAAAAAFWPDGAARIFVFAGAYAAAEWLRGHLLTGFPWNIAAYGWGASLPILQSAALFGAYGLTLLTILFGASLAEFFGSRIAWQLPLAMTLTFAAIFAGGELRLSSTDVPDVPGVRLRIVQPDIAQADKYRPALVDDNWNRLLELSQEPAKRRPTHIIWPEAAPPFLLQRAPSAIDEIALLTGRDGVLMTGALRAERNGGRTSFYNSFYVFGPGGRQIGVYDKFHLVPFGEYLPFENVMNRLGLTKIVGIAGSFATGDGPHTLAVPGAPPAGPLICYEILFPGAVVGDRRPGWFVNVTDDSWFGPWAGPAQHLLVARTRAIEEAIPVVRAANTGISAVIDPLGRIRARLGLDRAGVVDAALPSAIAVTPYARSGDFGFFLMLLATLVGAVVAAPPGHRSA